MKTITIRNGVHENLDKDIPPAKREQLRITHLKMVTGLSEDRIREIDKFIRNAERGCLRMSHDGADVTRQITAEQVAKFLECRDCVAKSVVSFLFKKRLVGVCGRHWEGLAETVIGWSGE